jgi:hypothetical protein
MTSYDVNIFSKSNKQKNEKKTQFGLLKVTEEKSRLLLKPERPV